MTYIIIPYASILVWAVHLAPVNKEEKEINYLFTILTDGAGRNGESRTV